MHLSKPTLRLSQAGWKLVSVQMRTLGILDADTRRDQICKYIAGNIAGPQFRRCGENCGDEREEDSGEKRCGAHFDDVWSSEMIGGGAGMDVNVLFIG